MYRYIWIFFYDTTELTDFKINTLKLLKSLSYNNFHSKHRNNNISCILNITYCKTHYRMTDKIVNMTRLSRNITIAR